MMSRKTSTEVDQLIDSHFLCQNDPSIPRECASAVQQTTTIGGITMPGVYHPPPSVAKQQQRRISKDSAPSSTAMPGKKSID